MYFDRETGEEISLEQDVRQSVGNILATPPGTRPMRPDYGSSLHSLVDAPMDSRRRALFAQATIGSLAAQEPRLEVRRVQVLTGAGELILSIDGVIKGVGPVQIESAL
ncbi:MAG: GPW/gp25 family protein [Candidatus Devosia euplotis]|nr:GPW/gp25 family protein [Candidatus Devosia euplotis]